MPMPMPPSPPPPPPSLPCSEMGCVQSEPKAKHEPARVTEDERNPPPLPLLLRAVDPRAVETLAAVDTLPSAVTGKRVPLSIGRRRVTVGLEKHG